MDSVTDLPTVCGSAQSGESRVDCLQPLTIHSPHLRLTFTINCCYNTMTLVYIQDIIGASEASPFLVFNVAILSVCLSVCMYGPAQ